MKKILLPLLLLVGQLSVWAQTAYPTVPSQIEFAGLMVRFDASARQLIQQDVNALMANRKFWEAKLDRATLYFPLMETALLNEDVPTDFKYLAVQESSLTPDAVSTSTAVGYWQFKQETAVGQGLRVDDMVDERKNIVASTRGAARYLKKNNATFNNWVSSLYSYYLGAGGVTNLLPPAWANATEITLDGRTDRYVLRFFAHKIAMEKALLTYKTTNTFSLIEYPGASGRSLRDVAGELGIDEFELRRYNRWLVTDTVPTDKDYTLVLPVANNQINDVRERVSTNTVVAQKMPDFVQDDVGFPVLRRITTTVGNRNEPILYEINGLPGIQAQVGDNANSLAKKAKISVGSFRRYNDLDDLDPVVVNEVYYLAKKRKKAIVPYHTVRDGETARSISQRYALQLKKLLRYNRLDRGQRLQVGRVMWLMERRPNNRPVEIINSPTPNVIDRTPTQSIAGRPNAPTQSTGAIPQNPSERKLYQPKLVPSQTVSPAQAQTGAAKLDPPKPSANSSTSDWALPAPADNVANAPVMTPAPVVTTTTQPDANGTERTIIVRSEESPQGNTLPTTRPPATKRPSVAKRPAPTPRPDAIDETVDGARPIQPLSTGGYEELPTTEGTTPKNTPSPAREPVTVAKRKTTVAPSKGTTATPTEPVTTRPTPPANAPVLKPDSRSAAMASGVVKHRVEAGQTYYSISKLYGVSIEDILAANKLTLDDKLAVGQSLTIKGATTGGSATTAPAEQPTFITHTVAKGETMYRISKQYNVKIDQIKEWNQLSDVTVKEGQKLKIQQN